MPDDIVIRFSVKDDGSPQIEKLNKTLGKTKEASQSLVPGLESARTSMGSFISANAGVIAALVGVVLAIKSAVDETVKYASSVRDLAAIGNTSTESASRFIQVLDDYKISAADALLATRALTNNGLTPSIDTLASLSDQYLAITDAQKKNEFVLKNLGRGGLQWIEVLKKGSTAIKAQGAAISDGLILSEKAVEQAREYEIALDSWNDTVLQAKIALGTGLLPVLTDVINFFMRGYDAGKIFYGALFDGEKGVVGYFEALKMATDAQDAQTASMMGTAEATDGASVSATDNAAAVDAQKEAVEAAQQALDDYKNKLEEISQANQDAESFIQSYADFQKGYDDEHLDAVNQLIEAQKELESAKFSGDEDDFESASEGVAKAKEAIQDLEASWHEATNSMIYDMALAKITLDGYTDAEFEAMQKVAVERGLRTQEQADEAIRMMEEANAIVEGVAADEAVVREQSKIDATTAEMEKQLEIEKTAEAAITGAEQSAQAQENFAATVDSATLSLIRQAEAAQRAAGMVANIKMPGAPVNSGAKATNKSGGSKIAPKNANGLDFVVPMSYGYEGFNAGQLGTISGGERVNITPNGQGGGGSVTIIVNNPIRETAEKSIRRELMSMSISGEPA